MDDIVFIKTDINSLNMLVRRVKGEGHSVDIKGGYYITNAPEFAAQGGKFACESYDGKRRVRYALVRIANRP